MNIKNIYRRSLSLLLALAIVFPFIVGITTNFAGTGAENDPYTVQEAIENNSGIKNVEGYIIGSAKSGSGGYVLNDKDVNSNIVIADSKDEKDTSKMLIVQLPTKIDFEARDKDDNFISHKDLTPKEFFELIDMDLDQYISVINAPTKDKPFLNSYTVEYLGNVIEGDRVKYVNIEIEDMKKAVLDQLRDNEPVWFGCDVGQFFYRKNSRLDLETVNIMDMFDVDYDFNKEDRLDYNESLMTHAMVFMGCNYDEENNKVDRYRVENSWGDKSGEKGFLVMSDEWFEEYMYQALINKKHLSKEIIDAYEKEPIKLKPLDPMGSLA